MPIHLTVDIGGTQLRAARYSGENLQPEQILRIPTHAEQEPPLQRLLNLIEKVWPLSGRVAGIAVAAPGPTDPYRGIIIEAPNIPGWVNLPLREILETQFGAPVALGNDANLGALGEWKFGAGRGHSNMIYFTISTGIGSGVISDNRLLLGAHGLAAEIGHITVIPNGPPCSCGGLGHLEAIASGTAIARYVSEAIKNGALSSLSGQKTLTAKLISQAAKAGDPLAISALSHAAHFVGVALADLLHIFNPTAIIMGGGVSRAGSIFLEPVLAAMKNHVMHQGYLEDFILTQAAFGDDAGLMGALALARSEFPG